MKGMTKPLLEVRDLHKRYGSLTALNGVSFEVHSGEMFGLLGPNGAGKTTTLSIISCLLDATAGEVLLDGQRVVLSNLAVRRLIGIVPQEVAVYSELTARENLHFFGELYGVHGSELRQRAQRILAAIGLEDRSDDRVSTFSGGMKRRLNLGAALVHEPRLLLLDEPTTGVDPQSRNHIFEEVRRLNAAGMTVVYTSHYMEEVQALCPRIAIIDHGRIMACDTLPNLLRQLSGMIRVRLGRPSPLLVERLRALPDCQLRSDGQSFLNAASTNVRPAAPTGVVDRPALQLAELKEHQSEGRPDLGIEKPDDLTLEIECHDIRRTLVRVVAALNEAQAELVALETEEPNLERVFLHLTGRALRD
jgi:ABC-2 type transport system ATP-binding protein